MNEQLESRSQTMRLFKQWRKRNEPKNFKGCVFSDKLNEKIHYKFIKNKKFPNEYRTPLPPVDFSNAMLKIFGDKFDFTNWETSPEYRIFLAGKKAELDETIAKLKSTIEKLDKRD